MSDDPIETEIEAEMMAALNRLTKWRAFYAGWQLGTRAKGDPESDAVRDLQEARLLLREEFNALLGLLLAKGIFSGQEFQKALTGEADQLNAELSERYPGIYATDEGLAMDHRAAQTMRGWKP